MLRGRKAWYLMVGIWVNKVDGQFIGTRSSPKGMDEGSTVPITNTELHSLQLHTGTEMVIMVAKEADLSDREVK